MTDLKLKTLRFLTKLALKHRWYYRWSKIYQAIFESKYDNVLLPIYNSLDQLERDIGNMQWRKDTWIMLFDAISTPQATFSRHIRGLKAGDCLPAGTWLLKANDYQFCPIEDIEIGDEIIGDGRPTKVLKKWFKGEKPIVEVKLSNGSTLRCTLDHRVFVRNDRRILYCSMCGKDLTRKQKSSNKRFCSSSCSSKYIRKYGPFQRPNKGIHEKEARKLKIGDKLVYPSKSFPFLGRTISSLEQAWLDGVYIADGWHDIRRICITAFDKHWKVKNKDRIENWCKKRGFSYRRVEKYIAINNKELADYMLLRYDKLAYRKKINDMCFDEETLLAFLDGLANDASKANDGKTITYNTVSKKLAFQIRVLHRMLGHSTYMRCYTSEEHKGWGDRSIWKVTPRKGGNSLGKTAEVVSITLCKSEPVYDIMTNSGMIYLPESDVVVHNCDDHSFLAVDRILDMKRRGVLKDVDQVGLLSIPWIDEKGNAGGHNVCAFSYFDAQNVAGKENVIITKWAHISNWYNGEIRRGFETLEEIVKSVLGYKTSLGWAFANVDLNLLEYYDGTTL